jgi:RNA-splicing ligase RtcB
MPERFETENEHGRGVVLSWASILEAITREQAERTSRSPVVEDHVALMPDAHLGIGATVGSVVVTRGAIIPAAVGVDIGCGIIAVQTDIERASLAVQDERRLLGQLREAIPNGVAQNHGAPTLDAQTWFATHGYAPGLDVQASRARAMLQFGTLGSGNHFAEFSVDEAGYVWAIVHSGSRGVGLLLANHHIARARATCPLPVEDPYLAFLPDGTPEGAAYVADMEWAQRYAYGQREAMMDRMLEALASVAPPPAELRRINCHHNYASRWPGTGDWVTRKGAIAAGRDDFGVIPGSMGTDTYIVRGLANREAYSSAPHGAGRMFSRGEARRTLSVDELKLQMGSRTWDDRNAPALLDEAPGAYKPIEIVMRDAADLVEPVARLSAFVNFKAADIRGRRRR